LEEARTKEDEALRLQAQLENALEKAKNNERELEEARGIQSQLLEQKLEEARLKEREALRMQAELEEECQELEVKAPAVEEERESSLTVVTSVQTSHLIDTAEETEADPNVGQAVMEKERQELEPGMEEDREFSLVVVTSVQPPQLVDVEKEEADLKGEKAEMEEGLKAEDSDREPDEDNSMQHGTQPHLLSEKYEEDPVAVKKEAWKLEAGVEESRQIEEEDDKLEEVESIELQQVGQKLEEFDTTGEAVLNLQAEIEEVVEAEAKEHVSEEAQKVNSSTVVDVEVDNHNVIDDSVEHQSGSSSSSSSSSRRSSRGYQSSQSDAERPTTPPVLEIGTSVSADGDLYEQLSEPATPREHGEFFSPFVASTEVNANKFS